MGRGVLAVAALALASCLAPGGPTASPGVLASVNGAEITLAEYQAYALVFTEPDGELRVSPAQVLLSLINQELVAQEATRRGLTVDEAELDSLVRRVTEEPIGASVVRAGGVDAFRERLRAHMLMGKVKELVIPIPVVSQGDLEAAYAADPALANLPKAEAWAKLTERLAAEQHDGAWREWLAEQRRCALIVIRDETAAIPLEEAGPC